ncbi:MAG: hypothetical protein R3D05_02485 [Dongiaceae bacterium]
MKWLVGFAALALIVGNALRKHGLEAARANAFGSAAALAGQRKSAAGSILNVIGAICVAAAVVRWWL